MRIQVTHKTVYGNELFYPANETAKTMLAYKGAKTFTKHDLKTLSASFEIECVNVPSYSLAMAA